MRKLIFILFIPCMVQAQMVSPLSIKQSQLQWEAKTLMGGGHTGLIQFVSGSLTTLADGRVTKGEFVLDMNSIACTDIKQAQSAKDLNDHLKGDDFFSVEKFPRATFAILSFTPAFNFPKQDQYTITGLLTIKGITHTISFPAVITKDSGVIKANAKISIDRTKWSVNYQSQSVFGTLKDSAISDTVVVTLKLVFAGC